MVDALNSMLEAMGDPRMKHAALVHMPVALSVVGLLLAVVSAIWAGRHPALRWVAVGGYLLLAVTAWMGVASGEDVHATWGAETYEQAVYDTVDRHEENAEKIAPIALAIAVVAAAGAFGKRKRLRLVSGWLAVAIGLGLAAWVGYVGHLGGEMVYAHGIGTPFPVDAGGAPIVSKGVSPLPGGADAAAATDPRLDVARQVRAILEDNCMRCHNTKKAKGGLDLTTMAGILTGGGEGPAVVPGVPEMSVLLQAARHEIVDLEMPADDDQLSEEHLALIDRWIFDGAVWD